MRRLTALLLMMMTLAVACQGNVFSMEVGQCFDDPDSFDQVANLDVVECAESHDNEVFALYDLSNASYPGDGEVQEIGQRGCVDRFEDYVGSDYQSSSLDVAALTPSSASWDADDREVICFLYDVGLAKLNGSAKDTGL